jgi:glucosamine-phosphate N-acetyltransferase
MDIRPIEASDYDRGYLALIGQLSPVCPEITKEQFFDQLTRIQASSTEIYVILQDDQLLASGTLLTERKFIHDLGLVGHIEDVVVDEKARNQQLGQKMVDFLANRARQKGCYKVILDCHPKLVTFYQKCGFTQKQVQMSLYFEQ